MAHTAPLPLARPSPRGARGAPPSRAPSCVVQAHHRRRRVRLLPTRAAAAHLARRPAGWHRVAAASGRPLLAAAQCLRRDSNCGRLHPASRLHPAAGCTWLHTCGEEGGATQEGARELPSRLPCCAGRLVAAGGRLRLLARLLDGHSLARRPQGLAQVARAKGRAGEPRAAHDVPRAARARGVRPTMRGAPPRALAPHSRTADARPRARMNAQSATLAAPLPQRALRRPRARRPRAAVVRAVQPRLAAQAHRGGARDGGAPRVLHRAAVAAA
eukprot:2499418-Prymnesium_polylepis.1